MKIRFETRSSACIKIFDCEAIAMDDIIESKGSVDLFDRFRYSFVILILL